MAQPHVLESTLTPVLSGQVAAERNENWSEYQQYASSLLALSALLLCLYVSSTLQGYNYKEVGPRLRELALAS